MRPLRILGLSLLASLIFVSCGSDSNPSSSNNDSFNGGQQNRTPKIYGLSTVTIDGRIGSGTYTMVSCQISDADKDDVFYTFSETGGTKQGSFSSRSGLVEGGNDLIGTRWTAPSGISIEELHTLSCTATDHISGETIERVDVVVFPYR